VTNRSKGIGTLAESACVKYLNDNGFPFADRRPLNGALDKGDILICPGVIFEVKSGKAAEDASDGQIVDWARETERERVNANAQLAFLVTKRRRVSAARAGDWWVHADMGVLADLINEPVDVLAIGEPFDKERLVLGRLLLRDLVDMLRYAGFGEPL